MKPATCTCSIYMNSQYIGQPIESISLPKSCFLLGLVREDNLILTATNPLIQEQDCLIAVALNPSFLPELKNRLNRTQQIHWQPT